jgi:hypothetical protein
MICFIIPGTGSIVSDSWLMVILAFEIAVVYAIVRTVKIHPVIAGRSQRRIVIYNCCVGKPAVG